MSEIGMARAGRDNQIIVIEVPINHPHFLRVHVDRLHFGEDHSHVFAFAQNCAYGSGDVGRGKRRGCDLIKQRLKQMVICPVDHRDAGRFTGEFLGRLESAESSADNHDMRFLCRHLFHVAILQQDDWMKAPNSKLQIPGKLQTSKSKERLLSLFWNLRSGISLELGSLGFGTLLPGLSWERKQKEFVIAAQATIFRASCRNQFPAAKLAKQLRNGSRSPLAAKFCAPNRPGVICFRLRTPNASGTLAKWHWWTKRTRRVSKPICRLVNR